MNVPKPLVLFLAFCGGAALFGLPLVFAAIALGSGAPAGDNGGDDAPTAESPAASVSASPEPASDEIIGELEFHAFDLGFDPASVELDEPGRYAVTFVNDGAILHDLTFADGTVLEAEPGETATERSSCPPKGSDTSAPSLAMPTAA